MNSPTWRKFFSRLPGPRTALLIVAGALLLAGCGRPPGTGQPTPLPPGTPLAQPTPDFASGDDPAPPTASPTADRAEAIRQRLAQQATQPPAGTATPAPTQTPTSAPRPALADLRSRASLSVLNLPTALGILSGGGALFAVPGGGAVANLSVGATLTLTGRSADGGWFAAYLADGTAGWVPVSQVRVFGDSNELEVVQQSVGPAIVATLVAEASAPLAPIGTVVPSPTAAAVAPVAAPAGESAEPAQPAPDGPFVTVLVEGVNVRSGPGTEFATVGGLFQNERVALLGRNGAGDWVQVALPGGTGWIFAQLVETSVPLADVPVAEEAAAGGTP